VESYSSSKTGGITWLADSAYPALPGLLARAVATRRHGAIKSSKVRDVVHIPSDGDRPALVLKIFKARGLKQLIRSQVLGQPALREWRALGVLRLGGVAAVQAAAVGLERFFGLPARSYLATWSAEGCSSLEELLLNKKPLPGSRGSLAAGIGDIVRKMHCCGVLHKDLHAGNILVTGSGRPVLIDLHGARIHAKLSFKKRLRELASFAGAFVVHARRHDRLRFVRAYGPENLGAGTLKEAARLLGHAARDRLYDTLKKFDVRTMKPGRLFRVVRIHELKGMAERSDRAVELARFLGPFPEERLKTDGRLIHSGAGTRVYRLVWAGTAYMVKVYMKPGLQNALKGLVRASRAGQSWINHHRLMFRGISAPKAVLYLEEPFISPAGRSYMVSEWLSGHETLDRFVETGDRASFLDVLYRLARTIARMHMLFLSNRDLKAQNILVNPAGEVSVIDPDGIAPVKEPDTYIIARDLMRLNASFPPGSSVSSSDRLRFLKAYCASSGLSGSRLQALWRETFFLTWDKWQSWKRGSESPVPANPK